jgi:hypothetical protein
MINPYFTANIAIIYRKFAEIKGIIRRKPDFGLIIGYWLFDI